VFVSAFHPGLRIGLLGGSFNPAHEGHLAISLAALEALKLDRVVWLVSPQNPLKPRADLADYSERLEQARKIAAHPKITISNFEAREGLTYTLDAVTHLKRRHPRTRFVLLIGADNLAQLPRWKNWTRLFAIIPIAVLARPGYDRSALAAKAAHRYARARLPSRAAATLANRHPPAWVFISTTHRDESASAIRARGDWPPNHR
ncbi:MAG: nicotinate-nucleotide adenylyltransferase, partial [Alphaproteobacteria bacterium]